MKTMNTYKPDDDLLRKYLGGDLSTEESAALQKILDSDPSAREYLDRMEKIWKLSASLGEIDGIDLEGDWKVIRKKSGKASRNIREARKIGPKTVLFRVARIAAIFILACLAGYSIYYYKGSGLLDQKEWITASSPDSPKEISLPDGSIISLNAGSIIVYPEKFGKKQRLVSFSGEAFFEIARDEDRPFIIDIDEQAA